MKSQAIECSKDLKAEDIILLAELRLCKEFLICDSIDMQKIQQFTVAFSYLAHAKQYILNENAKDSKDYEVIRKQRDTFFEVEEI
jgi:hypothetical protein